jgi:hypothetical protein
MPRVEIRLCKDTRGRAKGVKNASVRATVVKQMDARRPRFRDKIGKSNDTLGQVEQETIIYQRGLSAALAGLPHEKTDDPWYDAGWRHGAGIRALRTRKPGASNAAARRKAAWAKHS